MTGMTGLTGLTGVKRNVMTIVAITGLASALVGCGTEQGGVEGADFPARADVSTLLLSETFGDEGLIEVAADEQGNIGVSAQAKIGSSAERMLREADGALTIKELYAQLKGNQADMPDRVLSVSDAREQQRLIVAAKGIAKPERVNAEQPAAAPAAGDDIDVVQSAVTEDSFYATVCKSFTAPPRRFIKNFCDWRVGWSVRTGFTVDGAGAMLDRSYGWNHSSRRGWRQLTASTWQPKVEAFSYSWVEWGGTYTNAQAGMFVMPTEIPITTPELGVTHHIATIF
jgi:hypothetical protein